MHLSEIVVTKKIFDCIRWHAVIVNSSEKECGEYSRLFFAKAKDAQTSGDLKTQGVFLLLGDITSFMFRLDSKECPFGPMGTFGEKRTAIPQDLNDNHLDVFEELVEEISDAEFRARIADVLWIRRRDFRMAEVAIGSYVESAENLEAVHWPMCADRFERAMQLVASIRNKEHLTNVVVRIENVLDRNNGEDLYFLTSRLMKLLQDYKQGDSKKYAALAAEIANRAERDGNWYKARAYWEVKAGWHNLEKNEQDKRAALLSVAETYVKEAELAVSGATPSYLSASLSLQKAIVAFRKAGNAKQRIDELHTLLLEYQQKSVGELKPVGAEIDVSEHAIKVKETVRGKTIQDALFTLALMSRSPKVSDLRKDAEQSVKDSPLQHIFKRIIINPMEKVTEKKPSAISDDASEIETAIRAEMFKNAMTFHQQGSAFCFIEPAKEQINLEHNVRVDDFLPIVTNNPLIPTGREYIYARGLHAGLMGNFLEAAHLLIPQIENSLRYVLFQNGVITSKFDADGIQDEYNLNEILSDPRIASEVGKAFGDDVVFDLRGLLVERFGSNLRNLLSHGLIDYDGFFSPRVSYLWWLTLRLCCLPILVANAVAKVGSGIGNTV